MPVDLHLHTHYSDGKWSPSEVVEAALRLKLKYIAITDHDTMAGVEEATAAAAGRLEVIPGVEINTVFKSNGQVSDIHVLGYFLDKDDSDLRHLFQLQQHARNQLVSDTIAAVARAGFELTHAQIHKCAGLESIGRPHITRAIVLAGAAKTVTEAWERFMQRESPDYVARKSVSPIQAIQAIKQAGGIASIAHPGKTNHVDEIILELKAHGLDAVEAYHRSHSVDLVKHYIRFANRHKLGITGGSDCHGPYEDYPASIGTISVPPEVVRNLRVKEAS